MKTKYTHDQAADLMGSVASAFRHKHYSLAERYLDLASEARVTEEETRFLELQKAMSELVKEAERAPKLNYPSPDSAYAHRLL